MREVGLLIDRMMVITTRITPERMQRIKINQSIFVDISLMVVSGMTGDRETAQDEDSDLRFRPETIGNTVGLCPK